jgi:hypothetical protein
MKTPLSPPVDMPWAGKSYPVELTNGVLCEAERVFRVDIIYPGSNPLWTMPLGAQRQILLWAAMRSVPLNITAEQCADAICGEKSDFISGEIDRLIQGIGPKILANYGAKEEAKDQSPLAGTSGGQGPGPAPDSASE